MAIFRSRAIEAVNRSSSLDAPLLLPRPQPRQRWQANLRELRQALLPSRSGRVVRTQERRQQDPTECGAVSLAIVLQHHGCHVSLSSLRRACGVSRDGSDAANLVRAAQLFGLEAKGFKKGLDALKAVPLPAILFWNFDHFLVLDGLEAGHYWINDPASGRRRVGPEEFDRCYTGVVLTLQPGPTFQRTPAPPGPLWLLGQRLRQQRRGLAPLLAATAAATLLLVLLPGALSGQLAGPPGGWASPCGALLIGALALQPLAQYLSQRLSRQLQRSGSRQLQHTLLSLPDWVVQQYFSAALSGQLQKLPPLNGFLSQQLWPSLPLLLAALLWGLVLLPQRPLLSLLLWGGAALLMAANRWADRSQRSRDAQQRLACQRPTTILQGGLQDPNTLKASALERDLFLRWSGLEALAAGERQRLAYSRDLQGWIPQLLGWGLAPLLLGAGIGVAPELLVPMALGLALAQGRSRSLLQHWGDTRAAITSLQSLEEHPCDPLLLSGSGEPPAPPIHGAAHLELEAVSFGYVPVQPPLIANFSLTVQAGQRIAIVGGSASGKSTLARLMAGLLQPTAGVVKLHGRPLLEWPREQRLQAIAMVQQGLPLLPCSVRDNLTFWNSAISQEELEAACAAAAILERIQALPQGFDTPLQQAGQQLSGGENQRLQIAQALLQRPSLLILDEATSALDARTELQVEQALRHLACTQIVVAHRLSTIRDADVILVLEQGQLVQQGTHVEMAAAINSPYQRLLLLEGVDASMEPSALAEVCSDA